MAFVARSERRKRYEVGRTGLTTLAYEIVAAGGGAGNEGRNVGILIHGLMGAGKNLRTLAKDLLSTVIKRSPSNVKEQLWVLDSVPGKIDIEQNGEVERVLKTIQNLPNPVPSRRWLVEHLTKEGFSKSLADWLGTNLRRIKDSSDQMTWIFDIQGIYDMYLSYKQTNYWPFLEYPPKGLDIGIVRAEKSDRWYPSLLSQLEELTNASKNPKSDTGTVSYHVLEKAGHWLHVDNPSGLIEILAPSLVRLSC